MINLSVNPKEYFNDMRITTKERDRRVSQLSIVVKTIKESVESGNRVNWEIGEALSKISDINHSDIKSYLVILGYSSGSVGAIIRSFKKGRR